MRCSCQNCGVYMVQSEGLEKGCVCPNCLTRCKQCLGTDSVVSRESLKQAALSYLSRAMDEERAAAEADARDEEYDDGYDR